MLKYTSYDIVFREIPGETTIAVNLANCPNNCKGCHSPELQEDIGEEFTENVMWDLIARYPNATCICLMGGDNDYKEVERLLTGYTAYMAHACPNDRCLKTAWYSGRKELPKDMNWEYINFIKLGHYISAFGGLDKPTTNQRLYYITVDKYRDEPLMVDITHKFWIGKNITFEYKGTTLNGFVRGWFSDGPVPIEVPVAGKTYPRPFTIAREALIPTKDGFYANPTENQITEGVI